MTRRPGDARQAGTVEPRWIDTDAGLEELVGVLVDEPRYGLDTEFHGERTYWPRLALIQISWRGGIALVDPLTIDPAPLARVLSGPGCMVAHASDQDLAILERACGCVPTLLFDTQVAAGFVGLGTPSLASTRRAAPRTRLTKGDRLTDWTRRPLRVEQRAYAASRRRVPVRTAGRSGRPLDRGRASAVGARRMRGSPAPRVRTRPDPETAWWRIKGARQLRGSTRGVAQQVAAWRERAAEALDVPPRYVLSDLALAGVVHRPPSSKEDLSSIRGLDGRLRDGAANDLLAAVAEGAALDPVRVAHSGTRPDRPHARAGGDRARRVARAAGLGARPRSRAARDTGRAQRSPAGSAEPPRRGLARRSRRRTAAAGCCAARRRS